ncbi:MAG TPA: ATP-binding protein [Verrucomicrobiae bacterium]|jgi:signal transduction histidine kinase|nr:ATP-binding protein [Verrucomicrobiae bacterium]
MKMPWSQAGAVRSRPMEQRGVSELEALRILRDSVIEIGAVSDSNSVRELLLEKTGVLFPFAYATTLRLVSAGSGELEPVATRTRDGTEWTIDESQALGGRALKVLSTKEPVIVRNLQTDGQVSNQVYRKQGWVSYLGVPLFARGDVLGILGVYTKQEHAFSLDEANCLTALAAEAAAVLSAPAGAPASTNAKSDDDAPSAEQTLNGFQLLPDVYAALAPLNESESITETINGVLEKVVDATGVDAALIRMWKKETGASLIAGQRGIPDDHAKQMEIGLLKGALEWVVQNGVEIVAPDIDAEPHFATKVQQQLGFHSSAVLPLRMHNDVRGVLYLASRQVGRIDVGSKDLLIAIAQQIGISMENRELFERLKNSRDEIERASKIKGEFLAVMSHELRTPLSVVMGYAGMIKERMLGEINPQQDDALQKLLTRANDQLNMINAIMQITQLESRSLVLERHLVNLTEMLAHLKADYALTHTKKEVALQWEIPADPVVIVTDGGKLKEILANLINNAIKFTPQGTVTVAMSVQGDHRKKWVQLAVADTGVGIPKEQFDAIFQKFYQVDSSETRLYGGVGLGLYIVKHFAEFLGGKVVVASEPGRGSTFTVTIPYAT